MCRRPRRARLLQLGHGWDRTRYDSRIIFCAGCRADKPFEVVLKRTGRARAHRRGSDRSTPFAHRRSCSVAHHAAQPPTHGTAAEPPRHPRDDRRVPPESRRARAADLTNTELQQEDVSCRVAVTVSWCREELHPAAPVPTTGPTGAKSGQRGGRATPPPNFPEQLPRDMQLARSVRSGECCSTRPERISSQARSLCRFVTSTRADSESGSAIATVGCQPAGQELHCASPAPALVIHTAARPCVATLIL